MTDMTYKQSYYVHALSAQRSRRIAELCIDRKGRSASLIYDIGCAEGFQYDPLAHARDSSDVCIAYFENLTPEGYVLERLAPSWKEESYLAQLLEQLGSECAGQLVISRNKSLDQKEEHGELEPLSQEALDDISGLGDALMSYILDTGQCIAGAQPKCAAIFSAQEGKWYKPHDFSASTHILKFSEYTRMAENEFLCMSAARLLGIKACNCRLVAAKNPVLVVERFDRKVGPEGVIRYHMEDFCQLLGLGPRLKYRQLSPSTVAYITSWLRSHVDSFIDNRNEFARLLIYNYLIGNCDAHLKNYSVLYNDSGELNLAPAYDLICTSYYERYSRDMSMAYGTHRALDEIGTNDFDILAKDLQLTPDALKDLVYPIVSGLIDAVMRAGNGECGEVLVATDFLAEDLVDEFSPRINLMSKWLGV